MRRVLSVLIAVAIAAVISGCYSANTLTEMARIQGQQAAAIDEIADLIQQQSQDIAALRKQGEAEAGLRVAFKKAIKAKLEKTESNSSEKMLQAALLLARYGSGNITNQAIAILGYLGGEKAENALLEMIAGKSSNRRNSSYVMNALINMRSSKLRDVVIKLLNSSNYQDVSTAINAIQNRSLRILKKSDLPLLEKILSNFPNDNNNRYSRNNLLGAICRLDKDAGVKYICDALETADPNWQRELLYIPMRAGINFSAKSWLKIIDILGEPGVMNLSAFQTLCDGIARSNDIRLTDIVLPWAEFAGRNNNFRRQYLNMLYKMRDPKAARIVLELASQDKTQNNYYLNNFPGIVRENDEYLLADEATLTRLLKNRERTIDRLNVRDKKNAAKK